MSNENNNEKRDPLLCHWADQMASQIIREKGDLDSYTCASGITPSGTVHLGNFREIITVDLVVRALRDRGKKVRFIYSWDDYDVFRKVPANMPDPEILEKYLRYPITEVPDTTGRNENYARHHEVDVETQLPRVGIAPEFLYQASRYRSNRYAEGMRLAMQNRDVIKECLNEYRDDDHKMKSEDVYWPVAIFCGKCNKDTTEITNYDGEYGITYKCECGHSETADIRVFKGAKLGWRVDWPMRWNEEKVVFEPGGKDHISPGGSYDTAKLVSKRIYGWDAPVTMRYDFVNLKGVPGKMSSSKGKVIALPDALDVYQAEVLRYLFAGTRPNTEFAISFDMDVLKVYEDYDKTERIVYGIDKAKSDDHFNKEKRIYMLSQIDGKIPEVMPYQITIRQLTTLLQIHSGDIDAVIKALGDVKPEQEERLRRRIECAWFWVKHSAPDCAPDFCFELRNDDKPVYVTKEIAAAVQKISEQVLPKLDSFETDKDCQQAIYEVAEQLGLDTKVLFLGLYNVLVNKDQGPRLGSFFRIIGKERLTKIFSHVVADAFAAAKKAAANQKKLTPAEIDQLPPAERFS
ncbi:MAG: lysine--tRNA ligase, partial [Treponema sp.]|nr:lysine--tRNA ligase [Treponema sp.]